MAGKWQQSLAVAVVFGLLLAGQSMATTVYKTVDARGRVSFSDQPPPTGAAVEVLDYSMPAVTPSPMDTARLDAMRETTDRMAADRREREAHRAKLRAEARTTQVTSTANPIQVYDGNYFPYRTVVRRGGLYRPGFGHPPLLGPRPPIAHPPIGKPPLRPGYPPVTRDIASRYNQYPASLIRKHYGGTARRVFYGR